jgi:hypothetical protein
MKKTSKSKINEDDIEVMVQKYIEKHYPRRRVSNLGGTNMNFKPKQEREQKQQSRPSSNRIVNNIKINLTKPKSSGGGQPKEKKEIDVAKTERMLQDLERQDLEFQRSNYAFQNPNLFGFNRTDIIEHNRNMSSDNFQNEVNPYNLQNEIIREAPIQESTRQEEPAIIQQKKQDVIPKEKKPTKKERERDFYTESSPRSKQTSIEDFYRTEQPPQVGRAGLNIYTQPENVSNISTLSSDFGQRLSEQGYTEPDILNSMAKEIISQRGESVRSRVGRINEESRTKEGQERKPRGRPSGSKNKPKEE